MKTLQILIAVTFVAATSLLAKEAQFKLTTKILNLDLPVTEVTKAVTSKEFIKDAEFQVFCRQILQTVPEAEFLTLPSMTVHPGKVEHIDILADHTVSRTGTVSSELLGHNLSYKIDDTDGELRLQGTYKRGEIDESSKPELITIQTEEFIFDRACKPDTTILITRGNMHIFVTVALSTEKKKQNKSEQATPRKLSN